MGPGTGGVRVVDGSVEADPRCAERARREPEKIYADAARRAAGQAPAAVRHRARRRCRAPAGGAVTSRALGPVRLGDTERRVRERARRARRDPARLPALLRAAAASSSASAATAAATSGPTTPHRDGHARRHPRRLPRPRAAPGLPARERSAARRRLARLGATRVWRLRRGSPVLVGIRRGRVRFARGRRPARYPHPLAASRRTCAARSPAERPALRVAGGVHRLAGRGSMKCAPMWPRDSASGPSMRTRDAAGAQREHLDLGGRRRRGAEGADRRGRARGRGSPTGAGRAPRSRGRRARCRGSSATTRRRRRTRAADPTGRNTHGIEHDATTASATSRARRARPAEHDAPARAAVDAADAQPPVEARAQRRRSRRAARRARGRGRAGGESASARIRALGAAPSASSAGTNGVVAHDAEPERRGASARPAATAARGGAASRREVASRAAPPRGRRGRLRRRPGARRRSSPPTCRRSARSRGSPSRPRPRSPASTPLIHASPRMPPAASTRTSGRSSIGRRRLPALADVHTVVATCSCSAARGPRVGGDERLDRQLRTP